MAPRTTLQRLIMIFALVAALVSVATVGLTQQAHAAGSDANGQDPTAGPQIFMRIHGAKPGGGGGSNLSYHGGVGGVGVETGVDKVYLVYWGSQWNNNDPSGEAAIQQNFFNHVG